MTIGVGIALAFVAMLGWGIGDFMIQKETRKLGDWETLFLLTAFGTLILLPFTYKSLVSLLFGAVGNIAILTASGVVLLVAALLNFEAFKRGKLSVLEPLLSLEIVAASLLAYFALGDRISWFQVAIIAVLVVCLFLVSFREKHLHGRIFMEKGVLIFAIGAFLMGFADFLLGWGARVTDPITAIFFVNLVIAILTGIFVVARGGIPRMMKDVSLNVRSLLIMCISDNVAWIAYAVAMSLVPIAIATGLSESSIIVAVVLGLLVGKEKLQRHQKIGLIGALVCTIALAVTTV